MVHFLRLFCSQEYTKCKIYRNNKYSACIIVVIPFSGNALASLDKGATDAGEDRFGITQIYPTKDSGREWFVNMDDSEVGIFDPRTGIDQQPDWS